jgi:sugar/nucleoside kinase (ribokinase family)
VFPNEVARLDAHAASFDVICAGESTWRMEQPSKGGLRLRPTSGPINVAVRLRKAGLRVGLSTVIADDGPGRSAYRKVAASGVDVAGVTLAPVRSSLLVVDGRGDANQVGRSHEEMPSFEVPSGWSSRLTLLSGLSPVVSDAAALCRAARAARREGSFVLLDFNASLYAWAGRDARTIRAVLREVDVARCSAADLAVLGMDASTVRVALRPSATLVVGESRGHVCATGPFGDVAYSPAGTRGRDGTPRTGFGDRLMAAICEELSARPVPGESAGAMWQRALRRGHDV